MDAPRWLDAVEVPMEIAEPDRMRFWDAAAAAGVGLVLCVTSIAPGSNTVVGSWWA